MPFENNARLDPSQVQDERGAGGGMFGGPGGGGFGGMGGGSGPVIAGGGGIGVLILIALILLGVINPSGGTSAPSNANATPAAGAVANGPGTTGSIQSCQTGADANRRVDCRVVGYVNSVQDYWTSYFSQHGKQYVPAELVLFSGSYPGGCGYATEAQGPFYCPVDKKVYLDLSFFQDMQTQLGATAGPFAQGYVVAHEYGHHVQDLLGILSNGNNTLGPQGGSVRIELQADCLAGVWANHAASTGLLTQPSSQEIADALNAAAAVGDDRIQQETQGQVTPESWTHGSAAQRQHWLETGLQSGDLNSCDTSKGQV